MAIIIRQGQQLALNAKTQYWENGYTTMTSGGEGKHHVPVLLSLWHIKIPITSNLRLIFKAYTDEPAILLHYVLAMKHMQPRVEARNDISVVIHIILY